MIVKWRGKELVSYAPTTVPLRTMAIMLQRRMQTQMTPGGKGKRHVPSKPGQPPAVNWGILRGSILWELNNGSNSQNGGGGKGATVARIGVPLHTIYGFWLEKGTKHVQPRPWMMPALRWLRSQFGV